MAKGLRSKCKRANRAHFRKTLTNPIIKKRAELISKAIKEGLEDKEGVSTINALRSTFQVASSGAAVAVAENDMIVDEEEVEDEEEEEEEVEEVGETFKSSKTLSKEAFLKKRGSKPRINPGKELVWFK
jgi:Ran GTPase-activating protein (RanGAP) involved in mRNA processing and transport